MTVPIDAMHDGFSSEDYVRTLLKAPTARDKQRRVGASNISNGCARCLADDLLAINKPDFDADSNSGRWWLGAVIGTAIHKWLELKNLEQNQGRLQPVVFPETHVTLGEIPGYGVVKSTSDLYFIPEHEVIDYKTTTRSKLALYRAVWGTEPGGAETPALARARATMSRYLRQAQLYGHGMTLNGYQVRTVSLVFICRDGLTDDDVWGLETPFDDRDAVASLDRASKIWAYLSGGGDPNRIASSPTCWRCAHERV